MSELPELENRVVIVTGASRGIGRATAIRFASAGARVVAFARSPDALGELARTAGGNITAVAGDVSIKEDVERLFAQTESTCGPCEILVNNAGLVSPAPLVETSDASWERSLAVNVTSMFLTCRRALPAMTRLGRGCIINVASISGVVGTQKFPRFVSYVTAKAAVIGFTEALAAEVQPDGIRVNCISPGSVDTQMLREASADAVPEMTPAEIAEAIYFLATTASRPMNGKNLHVYGA